MLRQYKKFRIAFMKSIHDSHLYEPVFQRIFKQLTKMVVILLRLYKDSPLKCKEFIKSIKGMLPAGRFKLDRVQTIND